MRLTHEVLAALLAGLTCLVAPSAGFAQDASPAAAGTQPSPGNTRKTLIDYFLPMPIQGALTKDTWGAPGVLPRDPKNGLEDPTMKQWCYWDGQVIKAP